MTISEFCVANDIIKVLKEYFDLTKKELENSLIINYLTTVSSL